MSSEEKQNDAAIKSSTLDVSFSDDNQGWNSFLTNAKYDVTSAVNKASGWYENAISSSKKSTSSWSGYLWDSYESNTKYLSSLVLPSASSSIDYKNDSPVGNEINLVRDGSSNTTTINTTPLYSFLFNRRSTFLGVLPYPPNRVHYFAKPTTTSAVQKKVSDLLLLNSSNHDDEEWKTRVFVNYEESPQNHEPEKSIPDHKDSIPENSPTTSFTPENSKNNSGDNGTGTQNLNSLNPSNNTSQKSLQRSTINKRTIQSRNNNRIKLSNAESASQLAEGTLRSLRDLALEEALELYHSLEHWNHRLEHPLLARLELYASGQKYTSIGNLKSQIQAVLARRCAAIGELQQHLLRAGWSRGVAQWGVLGKNQWVPVAGGQGSTIWEDIDTEKNIANTTVDAYDIDDDDDHSDVTVTEILLQKISSAPNLLPHSSVVGGASSVPHDISSSQTDQLASSPSLLSLPKRTDIVKSKDRSKAIHWEPQESNLLMVHNAPGGGIVSNDPALAAWSVDAIRIVRDQLYRASISNRNQTPLPLYTNWQQEKKHFDNHTIYDGSLNKATIQNVGESFTGPTPGKESSKLPFSAEFSNEDTKSSHESLPVWAVAIVPEERKATNISESDNEKTANQIQGQKKTVQIIISNLRLMALEVSELLNSIETIMEQQRKRRLYKVMPPSRIVRSWYIFAMSVPLAVYVGIKLGDGTGTQIAKNALAKLSSFFAEHISEPLTSIYRELFSKKGREDMTDRKARLDTIEILKKMIKKWLNDTYPSMSEKLRDETATAMDISLIEARKEESLSNVLEMNNIIRMSLIEMQFIKKEMMNALYAIDELMSTNEINIKLAAMTPAFFILYGVRSLSRFLFYALLKIGKSKTDVYRSLRSIMLDIERLLVMRDHPPVAPPPPLWGVYANVPKHGSGIMDDQNFLNRASPEMSSNHHSDLALNDIEIRGLVEDGHTVYKSVLNSDDLGMLMLLVHEYKRILWRYRRRFSQENLGNISEDLAELTGEKGPVSVQQQLRIVYRMFRIYPFMMAK